VLNMIVAATTETMLRASAQRAETLVPGYANSARLAVAVLQAGAAAAGS
jgi:hypothetical protein